MDFAYRTPQGGAVIVDWKTGRRQPQPEGLQLGCYALYATEAWEMEAQQIQVVEANIHIGAIGSAQITDEHLANARQEISSGIASMRASLKDPENNIADPNDFPAIPNQRLCTRCSYREICPEYQAMPGA